MCTLWPSIDTFVVDSRGPFLFKPTLSTAATQQLIFLFLRKDFEQRIVPRVALYAITFTVLIAYVILLILQIVSWRASYDGYKAG